MSTRRLPPLDMHAHIDPTVSTLQLEQLGAVVFAATRTAAEFTAVQHRTDLVTVWGLGCHPGLPEAAAQFDEADFQRQLQRTAFVGEVGLDGGSPVPPDRQLAVFGAVLACLQQTPRLVSVHSVRATGRVIGCLEEVPVRGTVLHWWLGTPAETRRAVEAGCYFSVNLAMASSKLTHIPIERVLVETDHPFGNRSGTGRRQPGTVTDVEARLAAHYGVTVDIIRSTVWANCARLVANTGVTQLLSGPIQKMLAEAQRGLW